ncbi:unnamed protein product, partial [Protopolystoma xenopodis]
MSFCMHPIDESIPFSPWPSFIHLSTRPPVHPSTRPPVHPSILFPSTLSAVRITIHPFTSSASCFVHSQNSTPLRPPSHQFRMQADNMRLDRLLLAEMPCGLNHSSL